MRRFVRHPVPSGDRERGAVVFIAALAMLALLIITAIVVDLGYVRAQRREVQKEVDLAALAAGAELASLSGADPRGACENALLYLRHNIGDLPSETDLPCTDLPESCTTSTTKTTITDEGTAGRYVIDISYPVPDADIHDSRVDTGLRNQDGVPCERMAIRVSRVRDSIFAGIVGRDELHVLASAVVRREPVESSRVPNLWLLEPFGCDVLKVSGTGSGLEVGTPTASGLITADSTGDGTSCNNSNDFVIDVDGGATILAQPDHLDPPGEISLVAMEPGQTTCTDGNPRACQQSDVDSHLIRPQPIRRGSRATRSLVDHVFNCKDEYPDYAGDGGSIPIRGCMDADEKPAYIDALRSFADPVGGSVPPGWNVYNGPCTLNSERPPLEGNWYVACNTLRLNNGGKMHFTGGNVIFSGAVNVSNGGKLTFNTGNPSTTLPATCDQVGFTTSCFHSSAGDAAWVYQRSGGINMTGGEFIAHHTAFVQRSQNNNILDMSGGAITWSSPDQGPFRGLSLWSESVDSGYGIAGGGGVDLEGVFFTPEANVFALSGSAAMSPQEAQFISRRLEITGGAILKLSPMGNKLIRIPPPAAYLIR